MAVFRDQQGNFYDVPDEDLERFRIDDELPEGTDVSGVEAETGAVRPAYFWDSPLPRPAEVSAEAATSPGDDPNAVIPRYYWDTGKGLRAVPIAAAHNYPGPTLGAPAAVPPGYVYPQSAAPAHAVYFWDSPARRAVGGGEHWASGVRAAHNYPDFPVSQAAYNYQGPGGPAAYNYEGPGGPAAYNYEGPGGPAAYNYEGPGGPAAYNYEGPAGG